MYQTIQLKTVREQAGFLQEQLAHQAGLDTGRLFDIEFGRVKPTPKEVDALCTVLQSKMRGPIGAPLRQSLFEPDTAEKFHQASWDVRTGRMPAPVNGRY
jgi:transcriptional regulator with XRE-family HTH domain